MYLDSKLSVPTVKIGIFLVYLLAPIVAQLPVTLFTPIENSNQCLDQFVKAFDERNLLLSHYMLYCWTLKLSHSGYI